MESKNLKEIQDYVNKYMSSIDVEYKEGEYALGAITNKKGMLLQSVEGILDTLIHDICRRGIGCQEARHFINKFVLKNAVKTFIVHENSIVFAYEKAYFLREWEGKLNEKQVP